MKEYIDAFRQVNKNKTSNTLGGSDDERALRKLGWRWLLGLCQIANQALKNLFKAVLLYKGQRFQIMLHWFMEYNIDKPYRRTDSARIKK